MESKGVTFDPEVDGVQIGVLKGVFPAHLIEWNEGQMHKGSIPFNPVFRIAPEALDFKGQDFLTEETHSGEHMVGLEIRGIGIWYCPDPVGLSKESGKPEGWRNRKYVEFLSNLNIKLPTVKDKVTKKEVIDVQITEELDVLGKPVMISIGHEVDKRDKDAGIPYAECRKYPRVIDTLKWDDAIEMDASNILEERLDDKEEEVTL